ncbi:bifunctional Tr-type G domain [Babesia duncani]|uniref:Bifunctional Tr-type G domain n=1 Tax=Babesia duncani TaxID=323732 RepID=A0AAD9PP76_9APIC|nr:bifunctional Tr-type G domain [Babesia duncani]
MEEDKERSADFKFNTAAAEFQPSKTWQSYLDEELNESTKSLSISSPKSDKSASTSQPESSRDASTSDACDLKKKSTGTAATGSAPDPRPHLNIVFIGHIDAGKSTACGNILYLSGYVDERTIEKYEREAKELNRESWFLAFIMDTIEEERQKGKTVEVGQADIQTPNRRITILDCPGHRNYVPNMIAGATQADCGVLILSARKGEFETGFERGGQTREHALLAKTLGVRFLIVAVNKMDDHTCNWNQERYESIIKRLKPFLKSCGFVEGKSLAFVPISGLLGQNLKEHVSDKSYTHYNANASWYDLKQPTLFQLLDNLPPNAGDPKAFLRIPVVASYRDSGLMCMGKIESGTVTSGQTCMLMPHKYKVKVNQIYVNDDEYAYAEPGEYVRVRLSGIDDESVPRGSVLCNLDSPCPVVTEFIALVSVTELLEHRPLISSGYFCMFHGHAITVEVTFVKLLECTDLATKRKKVNPTFVKANNLVKCQLKCTNEVCLETFENLAQMGRFTLRDENKTIAVGKVLEFLSK